MGDFKWNEHNEIVLDEDEGLGDFDLDSYLDLNLPDNTQEALDSVGLEQGKDLKDHLPTERSDEEILNEVGANVQVDGTYDMATRSAREALAKDLHHEMRDTFEKIAEGNSEVHDARAEAYSEHLRTDKFTPQSRTPFDVMVATYKAINEKADEIEEDVYEHLAVLGATQREIGEEDVYQAIASAVTQYHEDIDRVEGGINFEDLESNKPESENTNPYRNTDFLA